jgi:DNA processing protein
MTGVGPGRAGIGACRGCIRRSWLLAALSGPLDHVCPDRGRLAEMLALDDDELLSALGGRRRDELRAAYARFQPNHVRGPEGVEALCVHDRRYPAALGGRGGPPMVNVAGGAERLRTLTDAPTVAIVGSSRATDYGMEMARGLARGLAASGVTVTSGLSDGIAVAATAGALEVGGATVAVIPGGLDVACPAKRRSLYGRVRQRGCGVSELPCGCLSRRWAQAAGERIPARLAGLTIVVEARDVPRELAVARIAQALGRRVAAVPGRVTSPASGGAHALLMGGASLVRSPADALELLCGVDARTAPAPQDAPGELDLTLRRTLERVGAGEDTPGKLARDGTDPEELLLALSELELMGLLARGDGGRYVPRQACSLPDPSAERSIGPFTPSESPQAAGVFGRGVEVRWPLDTRARRST